MNKCIAHLVDKRNECLDTLHLFVYQELLVGKERDFKAWCLSLGEKYKEYNEAMIKEHELGSLWYLATWLNEKLYGQLNLDAFFHSEMANYIRSNMETGLRLIDNYAVKPCKP